MSERVHSVHYRPAGSTGGGDWELDISPEEAGWRFSGLRVAGLAEGGSVSFDTGDTECVVLPLEGAFTVTIDGERFELEGRSDVFAGPTDSVYAGRDAHVEVVAQRAGRFALPYARARHRHPAQYTPRADVPIEVRGTGVMSRRVQDFGGVSTIQADRLITCEVITPGGNWSSYPAHKHDTETETESMLEEIYYYEVRSGPAGRGMAYQRVSSSPDHPIDVLEEVRSGDTVLIPHGWHGPSMAAPGFDLYYLNVMAGPADDRRWGITDQPETGWIRAEWPRAEPDPRLEIERP